MSLDTELAEQLAHRPEETTGPVRRMADWTPSVELLTAILNCVRELTQAVAALGGAKPGKLTPAPVPVTALERARRSRRQAVHESLVARLLPGRQARPGGPV